MLLPEKRIIDYQVKFLSWFFLIFFLTSSWIFPARALTVPSRTWGICFGNSPSFTGLRFNFIDRNIQTINGINLTLWKPPDKLVTGTVNGFSLGLIPYANHLNGVQIGLLGAGAKENITGITIGLIGAGSGRDMKGINIGGLGVGAGQNLIGLNIGLLGVGAGENVTGITIAGLGAGAGEKLTGLTICGLAVGAPMIKGITIAGFGLGGKSISGLSIALGTVQVKDDGIISGLSISAFNYIRGTQRGVAIGIVNYAYRLKGLQIGLVNIVRDNPKGRVVLPVINFCF
jgi:hypothetical protein